MCELDMQKQADMCEGDVFYNKRGQMRPVPKKTIKIRGLESGSGSLKDEKSDRPVVGYALLHVLFIATFFALINPTSGAIPDYSDVSRTPVQETGHAAASYFHAALQNMVAIDSNRPELVFSYSMMIILLSTTVLKLLCRQNKFKKIDKWKRPPLKKRIHLKSSSDEETKMALFVSHGEAKPHQPVQETQPPVALRTEATDFWDYWRRGIQRLQNYLKPEQTEEESWRRRATRQRDEPGTNVPTLSKTSGIGTMREYIQVIISRKEKHHFIRLPVDSHPALSDVIDSSSHQTTLLTVGHRLWYGTKPVDKLTHKELSDQPQRQIHLYVRPNSTLL